MSKNKDGEKKSLEEESKKEESKKEESKKEESKKDEPKEDTKKQTKKTKAKKEDSKPIPKSKPKKLETLIDLVENSKIRRKHIIVLLAEKGYLSQFYEEEEKKKLGLFIEPTLTKQDFKKIIGE